MRRPAECPRSSRLKPIAPAQRMVRSNRIAIACQVTTVGIAEARTKLSSCLADARYPTDVTFIEDYSHFFVMEKPRLHVTKLLPVKSKKTVALSLARIGGFRCPSMERPRGRA